MTDELTRDALLGGRIAYFQPRKGYRVGHEAPILASFALIPGCRRPRHLIDLGSGAGAIGLCLALKLPDAGVTLVESEPLAVRLATANVEENGWKGRVDVLASTVERAREQLGRGAFDLVVSNPPWFELERGQAPKDPRRQAARMVGAGTVRAFVVAGRDALGRGGRFCLAFPAQSLSMWLDELRRAGLFAKRLRMLHPRASEPANVVLVDARAGRPGGLIVEPPLFVRGDGDAYTEEARVILWGE